MTKYSIVLGLDSLLKEYLHNDGAEFRDLEFYDLNTREPNKHISISQREIITSIITSSQNALDDKEFNDFFITSATGSGKSMLFQLPAFYFNKNDNAPLTVVIEPLIALMHDQVDGINNRGYNFASYIDSTCTAKRRDAIKQGVKCCKISLLYIAPETLVTLDIKDLIGTRRIGLLVIDEAHTVCTWGRDFRPHYWFLTEYVERLRSEYKFPILCLTATAVYGGCNDTVMKTISVFGLKQPMVLIGIVRRNDIEFCFHKIPTDKKTDDEKMDRIVGLIQSNQKSLVYYPYAKDVQEDYDTLRLIYHNIGAYSGQLSDYVKEEALAAFREGNITLMLCTKAFGLGVDISDIVNCYHYAPTGELEDYIQEIGRCARDPGLKGRAIYDYSPEDLRSVRFLHDKSSLNNWQVSYVINHLLRNIAETPIKEGQEKFDILLSPEEFRCFEFRKKKDQIDITNKLRLCLLLISDAVNAGSKNKKMYIYSRNINATCFLLVPYKNNDRFNELYENYIIKVLEKDYNSFGHIYDFDLDKAWSKISPDKSLAEFKTEFFNQDNTIFTRCLEFKAVTRQSSLKEMLDVYNRYMSVLKKTIESFPKNKPFYYEDFEGKFVAFCQEEFYENCNNTNKAEEAEVSDSSDAKDGELVRTEEQVIISGNIDDDTSQSFSDMAFVLFEAFLDSDYKRGHNKNSNKNNYKLIRPAKPVKNEPQKYKVIETAVCLSAFTEIEDEIKEVFKEPWNKETVDTGTGDIEITTFCLYIPDKTRDLTFQCLEILKALDLLYYRASGGTKPKIWVRINGRYTLKGAKGKCISLIKQNEERFNKSIKFFDKFLSTEMTSEQRWDVIEKYFLGDIGNAEETPDPALNPVLIE